MKICKKHGQLNESEIRTYTRNRRGRKEFVIGCRLCHRDTASKSRNEARRKYREGLTTIIPKANIWLKEDRKKDPEKYKKWAKIGRERLGPLRTIKEVTRLRGITIEDYYEIVGQHENKCAICKGNETRKNKNGDIARLSLDHNHSTGLVRGLLCHHCNAGIGHLKESIDLLCKAIVYLNKFDDINLLQKAIDYLKKHECEEAK